MSRHSFSERITGNGTGGFTLIEILVAISMLAILMTSVYGVFSAVSLTKQRLDNDSADFHLARVVFDRLGRELQGVYYREHDQTTLFLGGTNARGEAFLQMTTTAVTPLSGKGTGIARVDYRLAEHSDPGEALVLMRKESDRRRIDTAGENDAMMRLAPGIAQMNFRFFANGQWRDQLDARKDGLPELVEVNLVLGHDETRRPFSTTYELPVVTLQ